MSIRVRIKVTIPSQLMSFNAVRNAIRDAQKEKTGPKLRNLFKKTVIGWEDPPYFEIEQTENFNMIAVKVYASSINGVASQEHYKFVNDGTKPHPIYSKSRIGFLIFQEGYHPSTRPWSLNSRANSRFGNTIGVRSVNHPGSEGRFFDVQIADMSGDEFAQDMEDALHLAIVSKTWSTGEP